MYSLQIDEALVSEITDLTEAKGVDRVLKLISILDVLSKKQARLIAPNAFHNVVSKKNELRINRDEFDSSFFQNKQKKIAIF
jgi:hypothetical protein